MTSLSNIWSAGEETACKGRFPVLSKGKGRGGNEEAGTSEEGAGK